MQSSTPASYQYFIQCLLHIELLVLKHTQYTNKGQIEWPEASICMDLHEMPVLGLFIHELSLHADFKQRSALSAACLHPENAGAAPSRLTTQLTLSTKLESYSELYIETSQLLIMSGDMNFIHEPSNYIINVKHSTGSISSTSGQYGH